MTESTPPMGDPRPFGGSTCGRSEGPTHDECGKPATWHVLWTADGHASGTCDEHYDEVRRRWAFRDAHLFGGVCNMPNTVWIDSDAESTGLCRWVVGDETLALASSEPAEATR